MKRTGMVAASCMTLLLLVALFTAGCISEEITEKSSTYSDFIGTWTINSTFLADGELCNAVFTFRTDGSGLRELISPTTGNTITAENLTWEQTGEFDNVKINYEDGFEEITSLNWLKGTWITV